jgi:hypothetical protein
LLILPRGYLLAYVIDRSKCFSFGFKLFVGWIFGIVAFTIDLFSANALGELGLSPWLYFFSAFGQVFSLEFVIYLLERKILLPNFNHFFPFWQKQISNLKLWHNFERLILGLLLINLVIWSALILLQANSFSAVGNFDYEYERIYFGRDISLSSADYFYPPADSLFKAWLAVLAGGVHPLVVSFALLFYYFIFLAVFYEYLPPTLSRLNKLIAVIFLSNLPLVYFTYHFFSAQWLAAIFLFIVSCSLYYFLHKLGNSYFYLGGIALAFAAWIKTAYLAVVFPLVLILTIYLLVKKRINYKQLAIFWFWPIVTVFPWLSFLVLKKLNLFVIYFQSSTINDFSSFSLELVAVIWFLTVFNSAKLFAKIKL